MFRVTGNWRKMHSDELHDLYFSLSITRMTKERKVGWASKRLVWGEVKAVP
jgi:hypothetical protein